MTKYVSIINELEPTPRLVYFVGISNGHQLPEPIPTIFPGFWHWRIDYVSHRGFAMMRNRTTGIRRVLVGRACRFRFGRKLFGPKGDADYRVQRLDSDILGVWGNYLGIPPGRLKLPEEGNYLLIAFHGKNVVGHVSVFRQWSGTDVALQGSWLTGLEVAPSWRGRGVGRELVRRIIDLWGEDNPGESLFLVVNRRNGPAISLFELLGFACTQRADWETKLRKPYPQMRGGDWAYRLMERKGEGS